MNFSFQQWDSGVDMMDWGTVKRLMLTRYCGVSGEKMTRHLSNIKWQGNAVGYAAEFAKILSAGLPLPLDQLVNIFLASLPDIPCGNAHHVRSLTHGEEKLGKELIRESRTVIEEAADSKETAQAAEAKPEVETTRDEVDEKRRGENTICRRNTEGAEDPDNPTDDGVAMPCWGEAGETAE
ncbi:hypothetical protein, conserved [Eimeria maxima]|uniref:Retrotransposon gag domain-containing protein n=1 Tax=Eimeria maxima TaxID=5804 RepID=U6LZM0_EIMMA|nr:hypothetical protein, conserved [Eimeria maxima]CDJ57196.1 hypothetical protein, conserved [Eimeria maxima]